MRLLAFVLAVAALVYVAVPRVAAEGPARGYEVRTVAWILARGDGPEKRWETPQGLVTLRSPPEPIAAMAADGWALVGVLQEHDPGAFLLFFQRPKP